MLKRIISFLFSMVIMLNSFLILDFTVYAQALSGTCGNNLVYTYDTITCVLSISGNGEMSHYSKMADTKITTAPWKDYAANIKTVIINEGVESIGNSAFSGCSNISKIIVPSSIKYVSDSSFLNCDKLTTAGPIGSNCDYEFAWTTQIPRFAFQYCGGLVSVIIPDTITEIGYHAFSCCKQLKHIPISQNIKSIGEGAFSGCNSLEDIVIPDNIISIAQQTFANCYSLKSASLPNSIKYIDDHAFYGCKSFKSIKIPSSVICINRYAFYGCENLASVEFEKNSKLSEIGDNAFRSCHNLLQFNMPNSVVSLGEGAFSFCTSLKDFAFSSKIKTIPERFFYGSFITDLFIIPQTITKIEEYAFCECENLGGVAIPPTVTYIHQYAIDSCGKYRHEPVPNNPNAYYNIFIDGSFRICGEKGSLVEEYASTTRYPFEEHAYSTNRIDATCTKNGQIVKTCAYCGLKEITDIIPELGHTEVTDKAFKPTCEKTGKTEGSHCSVCGEVIVSQKTIKAKGHKEVTVKGTPATFKSAGKTDGKRCSVCGKVLVAQKTIAKLGSPSLSSVTAASKGFKATWKSVASIDGYEIQYSTSSTFKSGNKTVTVKGYKSTSKSLTKLTAKKKYYVRIRAYKTINGKKQYSAWSSKKTVTTKK